jgi:hypothetical protein
MKTTIKLTFSGISSFDGSDQQQTIDSWRLLVRIFGAKIRSELKSVDPTELNRHYLNYIVHNVYSIQVFVATVSITVKC